ncbi:DUF2530 domain-containing protein [Actinorhabdospora filicis]|uniref:DUF2530 domain-containing protein n=1 Tax=Actinorhabdospora filicis TaxID=1785913 RepID=UPI002554DF2D|nr:DUF2530 domain-containing protein [Actinorhabdospora filicis]
MPDPRPTDGGLRLAPPPPDMPMTPIAVTGTALWGIAGLVMWIFRDSLESAGHGWWIDTCWAGVGLGLFGTFWMVLHDRRRPKDAE